MYKRQVVERTAEQCFIPLTVGGGIRTLEDIRRLLKAGADKISINTAAVKNPILVESAAKKFGSQCVVVALDARRTNKSYEIFTHGGRTQTGIDALDWAKRMESLGAGELLLTSMDRDGTQKGFDLELTQMIADAVKIPLIASGGVGKLQHLVDGVKVGHASAVLAASIFHFGAYSIGEAKSYMESKGIAIRLK